MKTSLKLGRRFKSDKKVDLYILNTYEVYEYVGCIEAVKTQTLGEGLILNMIWRKLIFIPTYSNKRKSYSSKRRFIEAKEPLWFWWIFRRYYR